MQASTYPKYAAALQSRTFTKRSTNSRIDLLRESIIPAEMVDKTYVADPAGKAAAVFADLKAMGVDADKIGDLWVRGDRGGQGVCTPSAAEALHGRLGAVREVEIRCEARPVEQLQQPVQRSVRTLQTVEALSLIHI